MWLRVFSESFGVRATATLAFLGEGASGGLMPGSLVLLLEKENSYNETRAVVDAA